MQASSISESRIFRMPSDYFPGKVQPVSGAIWPSVETSCTARIGRTRHVRPLRWPGQCSAQLRVRQPCLVGANRPTSELFGWQLTACVGCVASCFLAATCICTG